MTPRGQSDSVRTNEDDGYRVTSGWSEPVFTNGNIKTIGHSITMSFPSSMPYEQAKAQLHRICDEQKARLEETRPGAKR